MAYNQSDQYFEPSTDTDANFANSVAGQTNSFFLPAVYSKKVLNFFRKSSVAEAITNTDYAGEITAFGDTVRIIKEPVITVYQYERGADVTQTKLTDQEVSLVVDTANAFKFIVDDIETSMSHVNFKEVASSSAAYALRDAFDEGVIAAMFAGVLLRLLRTIFLVLIALLTWRLVLSTVLVTLTSVTLLASTILLTFFHTWRVCLMSRTFQKKVAGSLLTLSSTSNWYKVALSS
jgi:hypothetical protein